MKHLETQLQGLCQRMPDRPNRESLAAFDKLKEIGFPTKKWEDWRFTNLSDIHRQDWRLSLPSDLPSNFSVGTEIQSISPHSIVFLNGHYQPQLSSVPKGVKILTLRDYYSEYTSNFYNDDFNDNPYYLLNTAFSDSGTAIIISKNTVTDHPVAVHYIKTDVINPIMFHPRTIIHAESGSESTIIENHFSKESSLYFTNSLTDVSLDENCRLTYLSLQNESENSYHIHSFHSSQRSDSSLTAGFFNIGGQLVRKDIHAELNEKGADIDAFGLNVSSGDQLLDTQSIIKHNAPECTSDQLFKYILKDESKGVFHGKVIVAKDAQQTDAQQSNKNLLLSKNARINSDPQLEIYADDVKCSHGSTTGSLDDEVIFYLQSRGLDKVSAKKLLIDGFAGEIIDKVPAKSIQKLIRQLLPETRQ